MENPAQKMAALRWQERRRLDWERESGKESRRHDLFLHCMNRQDNIMTTHSQLARYDELIPQKKKTLFDDILDCAETSLIYKTWL